MFHESSKYLLHYPGLNTAATKVASHNAVLLNKHLNVAPSLGDVPHDGELSPIHGLYDAGMLLHAGTYAIRHGFGGIVACFNGDDLGCDVKAVERILQAYQPGFEIATPMMHMGQRSVLEELGARRDDVKFVSCMIDFECGWCGKCKRNRRVHSEL